MHNYILRRLFMMIPVLLGVLLIVFIIIEITPGDPATIMLGESATEKEVAELREELGLNDPMVIRFFNYIKGVVTKLDFGISYNTRRPVLTEIISRFPTTFLLAFLSALLANIIGIILGIISAVRQYSIFDKIATALSLLGVSIPNFWQGLMAIIIFSIWLGLFPASGSYGPKYWVLPAATLGTSCMAIITRMTRSSMLEVIRQDYIRTARAKGQTEMMVIIKHALKNALIPIITVSGMQFGALLGGSVLVETVFAIPGLGKYMIDAIRQRDFPVVQGSVLFIAIVFSFMNLLIDILYGYIDPRIKSQFQVKKQKVIDIQREEEVAHEQ